MIRYSSHIWSRIMCTLLDKPVENSINFKLQNALKPTHIQILNESYKHNVPKNAETHFIVVIVSEQFENQPLIKRHRMVNKLLEKELKSQVHALSIIAKTPSEWSKSCGAIDPTPACRGGFGK